MSSKKLHRRVGVEQCFFKGRNSLKPEKLFSFGFSGFEVMD
jgi:hypothetical protein